jgi:hypothetical protein
MLESFYKFVGIFQFWLKSDSNGHFTLRYVYDYLHILAQITKYLTKGKIFPAEVVDKNWPHSLCPKYLSASLTVLGKNK